MTRLRQRMIEDLQLRGLSEKTQDAYVRAVRQLSEHYGKSPDCISTFCTLRMSSAFLTVLARSRCAVSSSFTSTRSGGNGRLWIWCVHLGKRSCPWC